MIVVRPVRDIEEHGKRLWLLEQLVFPRPMRSTKWMCDYLVSLAAKGRYYAWDVWDGDKHIGSTSFWIEKARGGPLFATLNSSALLPEYRGNGIYHRMMDARLKKLRELKLPFFQVQCSSKNEPMVEYWKAKEAEGKVHSVGHYHHPYYSWRGRTKMFNFRGYLRDWRD